MLVVLAVVLAVVLVVVTIGADHLTARPCPSIYAADLQAEVVSAVFRCHFGRSYRHRIAPAIGRENQADTYRRVSRCQCLIAKVP